MHRLFSRRASSRAIAVLGLAASAAGSSGCLPPRAAAAAPGVDPSAFALATLDSGVLVRIRLADGAVLIGRLLDTATVRRGPPSAAGVDSGARFVVCEGERDACADPRTAHVRTVWQVQTRALSVRGHLGASLGLGGFYAGSLAGMAIFGTDDPPDGTPGGNLMKSMLVGLATGIVAGTIGSRIPGWELLYPCFHACGGGHYSAR